MARMMALCSLPRTNPGNRQQFKRVNGPYTLYMTASSGPKLPFGNLPRLLLAWVSTEAVRTQSRVLVLGDSLAEFMRKLGIYNTSGGSTGGRNAGSVIRWTACFMRAFPSSTKGTAEKRLSTRRWPTVLSSGWSETRPDDRSLWESKIELGEKFFEEVIRNPVPLDMNILRALKRSSLGLDLYLWLTYRTFTLKAPLRLSWTELYRQFGADPSKAEDKVAQQAFRRDCLRELKKIKRAWPDLQYRTAPGVLIVSPSVPRIPPASLRLTE